MQAELSRQNFLGKMTAGCSSEGQIAAVSLGGRSSLEWKEESRSEFDVEGVVHSSAALCGGGGKGRWASRGLRPGSCGTALLAGWGA